MEAWVSASAQARGLLSAAAAAVDDSASPKDLPFPRFVRGLLFPADRAPEEVTVGPVFPCARSFKRILKKTKPTDRALAWAQFLHAQGAFVQSAALDVLLREPVAASFKEYCEKRAAACRRFDLNFHKEHPDCKPIGYDGYMSSVGTGTGLCAYFFSSRSLPDNVNLPGMRGPVLVLASLLRTVVGEECELVPDLPEDWPSKIEVLKAHVLSLVESC